MNAIPAAPSAPLPVPLRSEAFAEDIVDLVDPVPAPAPPSLGWLVNVAPLAVALLGVAFALVPPLA